MAVVEEEPFGMTAPFRDVVSLGLVPWIRWTLRMLLLGVLKREVDEETFRRVLDMPLCDMSVKERDGIRRRGSRILGGFCSSDIVVGA